MASAPRFAMNRLGRATLAVLLGALLIGTPLAIAAPAQADDVGISTVPAGTDGKADGRTRFAYRADPGQEVKDQFLVSNTGATAQTFTVVSTDAFNDAQGDFALLPTATQPTGIGQWVHFENGGNRIQFDLAPGASRVLPFVVDLPADATPGDHVGGLLASVVTPGDEVNLDRRVATRLYARVSGQLQPLLSVSSIGAEWNGDWWNPFSGSVTLHYVVQNTGNISLAANTTASVKTWFGIPVGAAASSPVNELLPGSTAAVDVELAGIGQLGYLTPGVTLSPFVESQDPSLQVPASPVSRDTFLLALPWTLLILIALIVAVVLLLRWRRRREEARAQEWIEYTEQQAAAKAEAEAADAEAVLSGAGKAVDS
ncbi:hypothetical protein ABCS02_08555 [Microbacterium sp. X-17]|uniref:COG1470 family protein n=1 Tax=Microbacterium sp. X-17 TaxID=3144404 RepID=UPI0031F4D40F